MLKEIFSQQSINNSLIKLGNTDDLTGKGRHFKSRFIQPGVAGYPGQFGNVLITKESLDNFVQTLVGKPVVINHNDNIQDDDIVGTINNVWFSGEDGWYWCDGYIKDKTAQNLISDKGWNVSCSYNVLLADDEGGTENNIKYDMEFLNGVFTHLALVNNPRYERANIVLNSKTEFVTVGEGEGQHVIHVDMMKKDNNINKNYEKELLEVIEKAKNAPNERQKVIIGEVSSTLVKEAQKANLDILGYKHNLDVSGTRHAFVNHGNVNKEKLREQIAITDDDFKKIPDVIYNYDKVEFGEEDKKHTPLVKYYKKFPDGTIIYLEEIRTRQKTLTIKSMRKLINSAENSCTFTDFNLQRPEFNSTIYIITNSEENFKLLII